MRAAMLLLFVMASSVSHVLSARRSRFLLDAAAASARSLDTSAQANGFWSSRTLHGTVPCVLNYTSYHPSMLESIWIKKIQHLVTTSTGTAVTTEKYCLLIQSSLSKIYPWLSASKRLGSTMTNRLHLNESDSLSHIIHTYTCGADLHSVSTPIEPLVGMLRHPFAFCPFISLSSPLTDSTSSVDDPFLHSMYHMVLGSAWLEPGYLLPQRKAYMFDVGANLWGVGWNGSKSQEWFVEALQRRGHVLDAFYGWEETPYHDKGIFEKVPVTMYDHYYYYNLQPSTDISNPQNPLAMIKVVASPHDYVVLRLNVRNTTIQSLFIQQLLEDSAVSSLVDELFVELPGRMVPLAHDGAAIPSSYIRKISSAYDTMMLLRQLGIRAHHKV